MVERVTEGAGERLAKLFEETVMFGERKPWAWQRDVRGKTCAYVSLDATGVRQQGEHGAKADGRMAYAGLLHNPRSEHESHSSKRHSVRYLASLCELDELGLQLRHQAAQMSWGEDGSDAVCHLRALYLSERGQWESFWKDCPD